MPKSTIGGTRLRTDIKRFNVPALRDGVADKLTAQDIATHGMEMKSPGAYEHDAEQIVNNMSLVEQMELLDEVMQSQAGKARANFEYCNSAERQKYLLHCNASNGLIYADPALSSPYDTGAAGARGNFAVYAMDVYYKIYAKKESELRIGAFNHSSFTSGKPVVCAGAIEIRGGSLMSISNESGHYKPTTADLAECVSVLFHHHGVDLTNGAVTDKSTGATTAAMAFLRANGG